MTTTTLDRGIVAPDKTLWIALAGIALGVVYVLSPMTVIFCAAIVPLVRWAGRGIEGDERRWLFIILVTATVARVLVVLGLFLLTDHGAVPFGSLFGDEEYFIRRSLWIRNIALGLPVHRADFIYAYDDYSRTSFLYLLATLQMLIGPAPYGVHLFSIACYLAASIVLYRLARPVYGRLTAGVGLGLLLFLPSLFAWSISALKEAPYFVVMNIGLAGAVAAGRPGPWAKRIAGLAVLAASAVAAQSIREGGLAIAAAGAGIGLAVGTLARRPRLAIVAVCALLAAAPAIVTRGQNQDRVVKTVRDVAAVHWGHVNTPGYIYTILDGSFYVRKASSGEMTLRQGVQYVVGSMVTYIVVPLPWRIQSRAALSYLPEQMAWYVLLLLVPVGLVSGYRRDPLLTALLASYAAMAAALVAVTSGNVGTLVRHRGLTLPYLVWFGVLGASELIALVIASRQEPDATHR